MFKTVEDLLDFLQSIPKETLVSSIQLKDNEGLTYVSISEFDIEYDEEAKQIHFLGHLSDIM